MNYFSDAPEWIDIVMDPDIYHDILKYHPVLTKAINLEGIDGFYFIDRNGFIILVDSKNSQIMTYPFSGKNEITLGYKLVKAQIEDISFYYQPKIIIKNGKKFYKIISLTKTQQIENLLKIPIIRRFILSENHGI